MGEISQSQRALDKDGPIFGKAKSAFDLVRLLNAHKGMRLEML